MPPAQKWNEHVGGQRRLREGGEARGDVLQVGRGPLGRATGALEQAPEDCSGELGRRELGGSGLGQWTVAVASPRARSPLELIPRGMDIASEKRHEAEHHYDIAVNLPGRSGKNKIGKPKMIPIVLIQCQHYRSVRGGHRRRPAGGGGVAHDIYIPERGGVGSVAHGEGQRTDDPATVLTKLRPAKEMQMLVTVGVHLRVVRLDRGFGINRSRPEARGLGRGRSRGITRRWRMPSMSVFRIATRRDGYPCKVLHGFGSN